MKVKSHPHIRFLPTVVDFSSLGKFKSHWPQLIYPNICIVTITDHNYITCTQFIAF